MEHIDVVYTVITIIFGGVVKQVKIFVMGVVGIHKISKPQIYSKLHGAV